MKRTYLTLIITILVIGFAAVSTNLLINGTLKIGSNLDEFRKDVVFTRTNTQYVTAEIENEGKTISFETKVLKELKEQAILEYDITNKSLQYDADITINCDIEKEDEQYKDYIKIDNSINPNKFRLESGKTKTGVLTITLIKAYVEDTNIRFKCELNANAVERTSKGEYTPKKVEYEEILLHGATPVIEAAPVETVALTEETSNKKLIPVTISDEGVVTRADTTTRWYSYEDKKWANAVILTDGKEDPGANQIIKEQDIESYFVWIPKYRYKLWNVDGNNSQEPFPVEIEFGLDDTIDEEGKSCATPLNDSKTQALSGETNNCDNGEWMTHPAFITMGVNGFWVGKFEVGYKGAINAEDAQKDENDPTKVVVKPNRYSWTNFTTKKMFNTLKNYARNLESHMMKNTEWGAVAYLSHSDYGINKEVAQNAEQSYKTGYAKTASGTSPYNSIDGFKASTTGNITGIYDMSGGAWDRMAAFRDILISTNNIGTSGFIKENINNIGEKYFDFYKNESTETSYENRILGDATGEMGPFIDYSGSWYEDKGHFVKTGSPWFNRGGLCSAITAGAGQFNFSNSHGGVSIYDGTRLVLSPTKKIVS